MLRWRPVSNDGMATVTEASPTSVKPRMATGTSGSAPDTALGWLELSWHCEDFCDRPGAVAAARSGLELARHQRDAAAVLRLTSQLARLLDRNKETMESLEVLRVGEAWARRCSDKMAVADFLSIYSVQIAVMGDFGRSVPLANQAVATAARVGGEGLFVALMRLGELRLSIGRVTDAIQPFRDCLEVLETVPPGPNSTFRSCYARAILAAALTEDVAQRVGERVVGPIPALQEADRLLTKAREPVESRVPVHAPMVFVNLGRCRAMMGITDAECRERLFGLTSEQLLSCPDRLLNTAIAWARFEATVNGDVAFARGLLEKIRSIMPMWRTLLWAASFHEASAIVHRVDGRPDAAWADLLEAFAAERADRAHQIDLVIEMAERMDAAEAGRRRERLASLRVARREAKLRTRNEKLNAERQRLTQDALTDPLTRIGNRRLLEQTVETLERRRRRGMVTVAIVDIDHFKTINDRFSHQIGDRVIAAVARQLVASSRPSDLCVRWGGEEFLILFKGIVSARRLDSLLDDIQDHAWAEIAEGLSVTASLGAAAWAQGDPFQAALTLADKRLYTAKFLGRNRVVMA